ncbi:heavy metal-associated isoprenylated plant protein 47-like [Lolium rigidum]|uniref:heavy metal-associated isoprenylated plant protein 47-like n=1 Tax=Lolium rigidum TaxID=89674 RepID=UPI001F5C96BB|nr:heavy metal-associated isoprenylated plant protein 47-like [Lolium rigidum]XP_047079678.1 heavy metal-associated isoprenylated plant protein 47-like [Lolium rigidum]
MTQKIVIKVEMSSERCRSKAMALVAATSGVDSVALAGDPKDQVVVVGDGVDPVKLTTALRKKVGHAQLLQVSDAKKEEEKKKPAEAATAATAVEYPWHYYQYYPSHSVPVYEHPAGAYGYQQYHSRPNTCSIM